MRRALSVSDDDDPDFEPFLQEALRTAYVTQGSHALRSEDPQMAVELFTRAIEIQPTAAAYRGRAEGYDALGKTAEADADRTESDKL